MAQRPTVDHRLFRLATALLAFGACGTPRPSALSASQTQLPVDPGEHFLFTPTSDAESLLGRRMILSEGVWLIAEYREPGCVVEGVHRVDDKWTSAVTSDAGHMIGGSVEVAKLAALKASHEASTFVDYKVSNAYALRASLRGPCGDHAISQVNVGTGRRTVRQTTQSAGGLGAGVASVRLGTNAEGHDNTRAEISWEDAQAWSVLPSAASHTDTRLDVILSPDTLQDGSEFRVRVYTDRRIWLIVYFQEEDGRVGLLFPNSEYRTVVATPERAPELPPISVSLRSPGTAAYETLVVYAFSNEEDYRALRPAPGVLSPAETAAYIEKLKTATATLPGYRYKVQPVRYQIMPATTSNAASIRVR